MNAQWWARAVVAGTGLMVGSAVPAVANVVINEVQAAPNEMLLERTESGLTYAGYQPVWQSGEFTAEGWQTGRAPIGHGYPAPQLGTDLTTVMKGRTPVLYARKTFYLTEAEAARTEDLLVKLRYDDGYVLWINGREVSRANLGPAGQHVYHRQVTYRAGIPQAAPPVPAMMEGSPGRVRDWLKAGENVVAVTVSNRHLGSEAQAVTNNGCLMDLSLSVLPARVETEVAGTDFAGSNGASRAFRRLTAGVEETASGVAPVGSWLASAPAPVMGPASVGMLINVTANNGEGAAERGAMRWEISQNVAGSQAADFYGGPLDLSGRFPGPVTASDMDRMSFRFRWRTPASAGGGDPVLA